MKVLYVDDEKKARDSFAAEHSKEGISVETHPDVRSVMNKLSNREKSDLPDVIIMDLYSTIARLDSRQAMETNQECDKLIKQMAPARDELKEFVRKNKEPLAITTLHDLSKHPRLQEIPVILCTREGMTLLDDKLFHESITLGAEWMLKGRLPETQREIIWRAGEKGKARRRKFKRDVWIMIIGTFTGVVLTTLIQFAINNFK